MANEPSLSELTNMRVDPELGGGVPSVKIDTSDAVRNLNEAARIKSENDYRKYNIFLGNLKDALQDAREIADMPIATKDFPDLKKQFAEVMGEIQKNPKELFGGGDKMVEIQAKLNDLRQKSVQSKQDRMVDESHRALLERQPEFATPDNNKMLDEFWNAPLGKRKPPRLQMPIIFDLQTYSKGIFAEPGVKTLYSNATVTPDGHLQVESGDRYSYKAYKDRFNAGFGYQTDKYGRSVKGWAKERFDELPKEEQEKYGSPEKFWDYMADASFPSETDQAGNKKDIIDVKKTDLKSDPLALDRQKFYEKFQTMAKKFEYDKVLKAMGAGEKIAVERWKLDNGVGTAGNQQKSGMVLNDLTVSFIKDAQIHGKPLAIYDGVSGTWKKASEMNNNMGHMFAVDFELNGKKSKRQPDQMLVDEDGYTHVNFWKLDTKGKPKIGSNGHGELDTELTKVISPDELKATFAQEHKLDKSLEASNEYLLTNFGTATLNGNVDSYIQARSTGAGAPKDKPATSAKHGSHVTYTYKGKHISYDKIKAAADKSGRTVDEYINEVGINKQ